MICLSLHMASGHIVQCHITLPEIILAQSSIKAISLLSFIKVMTADAAGSRQEEGCLYFDLLRVKDSNTFITYEVFVDDHALSSHKEMPYVKAWGELQYGEAKPVITKKVVMAEGIIFAGNVMSGL